MAISKTQPMRPAEIELVDEVNRLTNASSSQAGQITSLNAAIEAEAQVRLNAVQGLQDQIGNGFTETTITQSLSATNAQVLALTEGVGAIEQTALPGIQSFVNRFRLGVTEQITVEAAGSYSSSLVYQTPFEATDLTFVMLGFADDLPLTGLTINLIDSTYSGFSYSVGNTGSDDAEIRIGFLAVKVN